MPHVGNYSTVRTTYFNQIFLQQRGWVKCFVFTWEIGIALFVRSTSEFLVQHSKATWPGDLGEFWRFIAEVSEKDFAALIRDCGLHDDDLDSGTSINSIVS